MITDFVKDGHVYFRCTECGAESTILKYVVSEHYNFPVIDHQKTMDGIASFQTLHGLCKQPVDQLKIFEAGDLSNG